MKLQTYRKDHPGRGDLVYARLFDMTRCAFPKDATNADVDAILKRAHFVVHCAPIAPGAKGNVWFREAGAPTDTLIKRIPMESHLLLKPYATPLLKKFSKGEAPRDGEEMLALAKTENQHIQSVVEAAGAVVNDGYGVEEEDDAQMAVPLGMEFSKLFQFKPFDWGGLSQILNQAGRFEESEAREVIAEHRADCFNDFERTVIAMRGRLAQALDKAGEDYFNAPASAAPSGPPEAGFNDQQRSLDGADMGPEDKPRGLDDSDTDPEEFANKPKVRWSFGALRRAEEGELMAALEDSIFEDGEDDGMESAAASPEESVFQGGEGAGIESAAASPPRRKQRRG